MSDSIGYAIVGPHGNVCEVFTRKSLADSALGLYRAGSQIVEVPVDRVAVAFRGLFLWKVWVVNGTPLYASTLDLSQNHHVWMPGNNQMQVVVWANNEEIALAEAERFVAHLINTGEWTTDWNAWASRNPTPTPGFRIPVGGTWSCYGEQPEMQVVNTFGQQYETPYTIWGSECPYCGEFVLWSRHDDDPTNLKTANPCPHTPSPVWGDAGLRIKFERNPKKS